MSQTLKPTENSEIQSFEASKKFKGRELYLVTDTLRFLVGAVVHAADVQDRDCVSRVLTAIHRYVISLPMAGNQVRS
jgi:putative transposase